MTNLTAVSALSFLIVFIATFAVLRKLFQKKKKATSQHVRRPAVRRKCRWKIVGVTSENLTEFKCKSCGVTAYSSNRKGPEQCKRDLVKVQSL